MKNKSFKTWDTSRGNITKTIGASFVDDTDLLTNQPTGNEKEITKNANELAQQYSYLLASTGGSNSIPKTFYWGVEWEEKEGELKMKKDLPSELLLKPDRGSDSCPITRLEPDAPSKTLGIYECPSGDNNNNILK